MFLWASLEKIIFPLIFPLMRNIHMSVTYRIYSHTSGISRSLILLMCDTKWRTLLSTSSLSTIRLLRTRTQHLVYHSWYEDPWIKETDSCHIPTQNTIEGCIPYRLSQKAETERTLVHSDLESAHVHGAISSTLPLFSSTVFYGAWSHYLGSWFYSVSHPFFP